MGKENNVINMKFKVINLDRTPQRLYNFKKNNPNFLFERFKAIDGKLIDKKSVIDTNIFTKKCADRYTSGAIGVALSHRELWLECVKSKTNFTIVEDDAYLINNFNEVVVNSINSFSKQTDWDFIFWGANFDQKNIIELSPNIAAAEIKYNFSGILSNIDILRNQKDIYPHLFRTYWTVGLVCYSLTPKTAEYLLDNLFPIKDYFDWRDNYGIDNSIIEELSNMKAFLSLPPVALTKNDRYNSTVQENNYGLEIKIQK